MGVGRTVCFGDVAIPPELTAAESTVRERLLKAGFNEEFVVGVAIQRLRVYGMTG